LPSLIWLDILFIYYKNVKIYREISCSIVEKNEACDFTRGNVYINIFEHNIDRKLHELVIKNEQNRG